jgi:holo-[acyl-carrier protein] synthase
VIAGIGVDLVAVSRIAESVQSETFRRKVFTPEEVEHCEAAANAAERYAGKFAAKEAFMKAIGRGIRQAVWFSQIEVGESESGAPQIRASGEAERALQALAASRIHVSITHSEGMAVAMVLIET